MDHTVPKGPNQLGQLSEMYSLAKALRPYLQQYPITAKLSVLCYALCSSPFSTSQKNLFFSIASNHSSLYKAAPVSKS